MTTADTTTRRPAAARNAAGFTLMEIMIAMGIFAVGMIAVASVFPAAALLQKQTIDDLLAKQTARNAEAMLNARKYDETALLNAATDTNDVQPIPLSLFARWSQHDRSFGSKTTDVEDRDFYWVPLVQQREDGAWRVFIFPLRRGDTPSAKIQPIDKYPHLEDANPSDPKEVPHVVGIDITGYNRNQFFFNNDHWPVKTADDGTKEGDKIVDQIRPGDEIIDNNGTIYTVTEADYESVTVAGFIFPNPNAPTKLWYGRPAANGLLGPSKPIIILSNAVR